MFCSEEVREDLELETNTSDEDGEDEDESDDEEVTQFILTKGYLD